MISVRLADEVIPLEAHSTLSELLLKQGYSNKGYAVMLNQQFIPSMLYQTTLLQDKDLIEIVVPMQGG